MRLAVIHRASGARPCRPLVVRGGLVHTFGSLAGFLVVTFLCWGLYILQQAFANPLDAGGAALISAAFIITLAAMLLFFLVKPGRRPATSTHDHIAGVAHRAVRPYFKPGARAARQDNLRNDLTYQRFYVDHSRIRP
jgi:hypothetical protein